MSIGTLERVMFTLELVLNTNVFVEFFMTTCFVSLLLLCDAFLFLAHKLCSFKIIMQSPCFVFYN